MASTPMLVISFVGLSVAVALGMALAAGYGPPGCARWRRRGRAAVVHGAFGSAGLLALALALRNARLSGPFAWDAGVLLGSGLFLGLSLALVPKLGAQTRDLALMLHAILAGVGYLIVAGFALG